MNVPSPEDADRERDALAAYAEGDPVVVRAAAPREPSEDEWEATRLRIHSRLSDSASLPGRRRRVAFWVALGSTLTAAAASLAWMVFPAPAPKNAPAPEFVETTPANTAPDTPTAPAPHEPQPDPLAEFAVLPMAGSDDVVIHRVPGDGWLPIGNTPLPDSLSFATPDDVEVEDANQSWPKVTPSPKDVPMIFAAKPR